MIYEKEKRYIVPFDDVPSPRAEMPEISVDERRLNFTEVETGFPKDIANAEAKRCLSCRRCLGCALCWAECGPEAIDFDIPDETFDLEFDKVLITKGQDNAFYALNKNLGYGDYADVITDLQFERMLSPTGPTDGMVLSPLDGEIPRKLAIVQGHPEDGEDHLCSSLVLGVNESILALNRVDDLTITLVSPLCNRFKAQFLEDAEKIANLRIKSGVAESVVRKDIDQPLTLAYSENEQSQEETFDLIVVLTKPKSSSEMAALAKKLDQEIL